MPLQNNITGRRDFRLWVANVWAFAATDAIFSLIVYGTKAIIEPRQPGPDRIALAVAILLMASCGSREEVGFISGSPEDEKSIREIIDKNESDHYTKDVDWENAFGGRFLGRETVKDFVETTVRPTLKDVQSSSRVTVRFLGKDLALVDSYWRMLGQTGDSLRVGRNTYVLTRGSNEWRILVVRVADLRVEPLPTLTIDAGNLWPLVKLSDEQLSFYEGEYEETFLGGMPVPIRVWLEKSVLRTETRTYGVIDLIPMGKHIFATGRYADGELVEVYWPNQRQIFKVESERVMEYKVMEGETELGSAKRVGQ